MMYIEIHKFSITLKFVKIYYFTLETSGKFLASVTPCVIKGSAKNF